MFCFAVLAVSPSCFFSLSLLTPSCMGIIIHPCMSMPDAHSCYDAVIFAMTACAISLPRGKCIVITLRVHAVWSCALGGWTSMTSCLMVGPERSWSPTRILEAPVRLRYGIKKRRTLIRLYLRFEWHATSATNVWI